MTRQKKRKKPNQNPGTSPVQVPPPAIPATDGVIRWLASLLLLALAFFITLQPDLRMGRLWTGGDGIPRYKLDFQVDGIPAQWGYACWNGPFVENLKKFGFPPEGLVNGIHQNLAPVLDHNIEGGTLEINGASFSTGIGVHTPSKISFSLGGKAGRFSCLAGLDTASKDSLGVIYSLVADGREIFRSPKLKSDADPLPIEVSVAGVKELILCADTTEFADLGSDVDWVNLKFEP
jgi:hypothetical protein